MSSVVRSTTRWEWSSNPCAGKRAAIRFRACGALAFACPSLAHKGVCSPSVSLELGPPGDATYRHLICETFKAQAGVDILHVPYRGTSKSMPDFVAGLVHPKRPHHLPHVAADKAKLLAVLGQERRPDFPNVPPSRNYLTHPAGVPVISGPRFPGVGRHICPTLDTAIDRRGHELRVE